MGTHEDIVLELEEALAHRSASQRSETLRRVTDVFVSGALHYSADQVALFDDVIGRLAAEIESAARAELAIRLAPIPNAPATVIRNLAFDDDIAIAGPVLAQSGRLDDVTLVKIMNTADQPHLLAISRREALSETVTGVLIERGDRDVVKGTVENGGARFSQFGYSILLERCRDDDDMALCVGTRADLPRHLFLQLLAKASGDVCRKLEQTNVQGTHEIQRVVATVATRISAKTAARSRDYRSAQALIESLHSSGKLGETDLDAFAKAERFEETMVTLASLCGVPLEIAERATMQERPEALLIMAKAAGLAWPTVKSLLLLRIHCGAASAHELHQCLAPFHRLRQSTARQALCLPRFSGERAG